MAKPSAKKKAKQAESEADESAPEEPTGADQWAQVVMDGVPDEDGAIATDEPNTNTEQTADTPPEDLDQEIIDAEIIDLEDIDIDDSDLDDYDPADEVEDGDDPAEEADVVMETNEESDEQLEQIEESEQDEESQSDDVTEASDSDGTHDADSADELDDAESADEASDLDGSEATGERTDDTESSEAGAAADISVEDLVHDLERVTTERDKYLDASRRLQAEFENYKKQVGKREAEARDRANDSLVGELLPVLDAFDGALANGAVDVGPMRTSFLDALAKQGLERIEPSDGVFDPNLHEAVMHEDADDTDGPVVAEVMRAGYAWKGRVLRPAMVRTRG